MTDLENTITDVVATYLNQGVLEELLKKHLDLTISKIIEDSFRYGAMHQQLKEVINTALQIDTNCIDVVSYNKVITDIIEAQLNQAIAGRAKDAITQVLTKAYREMPPELTLQELIEQIIEEQREQDSYCVCHSDDNYFHVEIEKNEVDGNFDSIWLSIKESKEKYASSVAHLYLMKYLPNDEHHHICVVQDMDIGNPTSLHGLNEWLFQLYAARTPITNVHKLDLDKIDLRKDTNIEGY